MLIVSFPLGPVFVFKFQQLTISVIAHQLEFSQLLCQIHGFLLITVCVLLML